MRARDVAAHRTLPAVAPDATVADAARIMLAGDARAVVVNVGGRPVGILTDRDVVARVVARELPLSTAVEAVMTPEPVTVAATASASHAYATLKEYGFRHLPVVDDGITVGLLVRDDLVSELIGDLPRRCPHCGSMELAAVNDGESTNLLCVRCRQCWHPGPDSLVRVDTETCPGCPDRFFCRFPLLGWS